MRALDVTRIADFVLNYRGQARAAAGDVHTAGLLNTPILVAEATANPRYSWDRNHGVRRKIGTQLWVYDCLNCDKCVPVCPNDANFTYETAARHHRVRQLRAAPRRGAPARPAACSASSRRISSRTTPTPATTAATAMFSAPKTADRSAGSRASSAVWRATVEHAEGDGFYIDWESHRAGSRAHDPRRHLGRVVRPDALSGSRSRIVRDRAAEIEVRLSDSQALGWKPRGGAALAPRVLDMLPYLKLKLLAESVGDPRHVHFANVAGLSGGFAW